MCICTQQQQQQQQSILVQSAVHVTVQRVVCQMLTAMCQMQTAMLVHHAAGLHAIHPSVAAAALAYLLEASDGLWCVVVCAVCVVWRCFSAGPALSTVVAS
jgi:hypothetical protein